MKKIILALMALVATMNLNAQFVLTPNNFVLENDASKNYEVLYFDSISKHDLYRFAKSYLEGIFNNPQKVLNCTEDDHIIVDYEGDSFSVSGGWSWAKYDVCYKYTFEFKDGKIRVIPFFKNIVQRGDRVMERLFLSSAPTLWVRMLCSERNLANASSKKGSRWQRTKPMPL